MAQSQSAVSLAPQSGRSLPSVVPGINGRAGITRGTRYSLISSPPPDLEVVIDRLVRKEPRRGFTTTSALKGCIRAASREYSQDRGPCDDMLRFLRQHTVIIDDEAVLRKCFLIDEEQGRRVLKAAEQGVDLALQDDAVVRARFRELALRKGLRLDRPASSTDDDLVPVPEDDLEDEDSDGFVTLDPDDLDPADQDDDSEEDEILPPVPPPPPEPLAFLLPVSTLASLPILENLDDLGAFQDKELDLYEDNLHREQRRIEAVLNGIDKVRADRVEQERLRLEAEAKRKAEAARLELEAQLAAAEAEESRARQAAAEAEARIAAARDRAAALRSQLEG